MIDEMILGVKEISRQKSCLGILARGEWLALVYKRLSQSLRLKRMTSEELSGW